MRSSLASRAQRAGRSRLGPGRARRAAGHVHAPDIIIIISSRHNIVYLNFIVVFFVVFVFLSCLVYCVVLFLFIVKLFFLFLFFLLTLV